jgi:glutamyl-tRNA synthetase
MSSSINSPVVTRFAPSPTGALHLGSARTALYSWLHARQAKGTFILRIEDTDLERSTLESVDGILDGMEWLGLNWDHGPFYQSQRFDRYKEVVAQLLESGHAYRCICSKERLEELRLGQQARKEKHKYDGACREAQLPDSMDKPFVVRFKNPQTGSVLVEDLVHGSVYFDNNELDDLIVARSDGVPTYNLCVLVDDWDMGVTTVIRGDDHLNNTPRQINILKALEAPLPKYAHIPMILGPDGKRLSKRHGAVSVQQFREEGFLAQALINYLVRLGWSHGDQEIFSSEQLVDYFSVAKLNRAAAALNYEKLLWLNQHYIKTMPVAELAKILQPYFESQALDLSLGPDLSAVIPLQVDRAKTLVEIVEKSAFFYQTEVTIAAELLSKHVNPTVLEALRALLAGFEALDSWTAELLHERLKQTALDHGLGLGKLAQPLRIALTGGTVSPPMDLTLEVLGREKSLARLLKLIELSGAV